MVRTYFSSAINIIVFIHLNPTKRPELTSSVEDDDFGRGLTKRPELRGSVEDNEAGRDGAGRRGRGGRQEG